MKRFRAAGIAGAATAVLLGAGIAYSAIPDSGGVIHACFKSSGDLRVIDTGAAKNKRRCKRGEKALSWNQRGRAGADGPTGPPGSKGEPGANGSQGPPGARGPQGPTGATGNAGAKGPSGPQGPKGATGANGTRGATGQQGPKGATGSAGVNGVSGYQLVSSGVTSVPSGSTASSAAFCPAGKKVVGGGWDSDAVKNVFVMTSTPNASGTAWLGSIQNNSVGTVNVVLTAACVTATTS